MVSHLNEAEPAGVITAAELAELKAKFSRLQIAAYLIAQTSGSDIASILLKRRPERGGFWQGVSGGVESFDASLEAAIIREINEETGLTVAQRQIIQLPVDTRFDFELPKPGGRLKTHREFSFGVILDGSQPVEIRLSDEHTDISIDSPEKNDGLLKFDENKRAHKMAAQLARIRLGRQL